MKIGSLFSGVGGLELGLEASLLGETIWQSEVEPACQTVLQTRFPSALQLGDVRVVGKGDGNLPAVDVICGGFP